MALFKAVVWALIFLTKLRFPPGVSIAIVLEYNSIPYGHNRNGMGSIQIHVNAT